MTQQRPLQAMILPLALPEKTRVEKKRVKEKKCKGVTIKTTSLLETVRQNESKCAVVTGSLSFWHFWWRIGIRHEGACCFSITRCLSALFFHKVVAQILRKEHSNIKAHRVFNAYVLSTMSLASGQAAIRSETFLHNSSRMMLLHHNYDGHFFFVCNFLEILIRTISNVAIALSKS